MGNGQFEKVQTSIYPRNSSYSYHLQDVNSDGLLVADSINSTLFTSYAYDEYGRLQKEKETVAANRWIEKGYIFY
jgi:hypothetical protein